MERWHDVARDEWVVVDAQGTEICRIPTDVAAKVAESLKQNDMTTNWIKKDPPGVAPGIDLPKSVTRILSDGRVVTVPLDKQPIKETEQTVAKHNKSMTDAPPAEPLKPSQPSESSELELKTVPGCTIGDIYGMLQPDESSKKGTTWVYSCDGYDYYDNWE